MRSGEKLGGGGDNVVNNAENVRITEREIGAKVLDAYSELGEPQERLRQMDETVFESVDVRAVVERTAEVAERIDLNKLSELRDGLRKNENLGIVRAEEYFAEVLGLSLKPYVVNESMDETVMGSCRNGGSRPDRIKIDIVQHKGDMDSVLQTLAHENWHSYQNDVMRRSRAEREAGGSVSKELAELAKLYEYNHSFYVRGELDYTGYHKQLIEIEAETFETLIKMKIDKIKLAERSREETIVTHPEIYGDENLAGIEREVDGVLHGLDLGQFLSKVGVGNLSELWNVDENEQIAEGYVVALSDLVGLKEPLEVKFEDEFENGKRAFVSYSRHKVILNRKRVRDLRLISFLPEIIWNMRQRETIREDPESERGKMYEFNLKNYVKDSEKTHEAYKRQLAVREKDYFVNEFLSIIDEQTLEEEIESMDLDERVAAREEQERVGWKPVVSEKYEIKRS